jgi:hypothetical protein
MRIIARKWAPGARAAGARYRLALHDDRIAGRDEVDGQLGLAATALVSP